MPLRTLEADLHDPAHTEAILALLDEYAQEPMIDGKPLGDAERRRLIPALRRHPTTRVFLAYDGDEAVGVAVCFVGFSTFAARPLLNVHDIAVRPGRRGQGIGRRLLQAAEDTARAENYCRLTLEVKDANRAARLLYERFGFELGIEGDDAQRFMTKHLD